MSQTTAGRFPLDPNFVGSGINALVGAEFSPMNAFATRRTNGFIRTAQLQNQPTIMESWNLLGWSVRARLVAAGTPQNMFGGGPFTSPWARLGDLWVGLMLDAPLQNAGGFQLSGVTDAPGIAAFPQDLSTFGKLWAGSDPVAWISDSQASLGINIADQDCSLLGLTFMFGSPIRARSGAQLQMTTILTPSITNGVSLYLRSMDFSVIYDT